MSKEKQIEEIMTVLTEAHHEMDVAWTNHFTDKEKFPKPKPEHTILAEHLYNAGYRKQSEWISVEERLPDCEQGAESEAVLFITKQGFMYTGYYGCGGIFHDRYFREFKNATEGYDISNVTHWMPLPEAPKMKGGE